MHMVAEREISVGREVLSTDPSVVCQTVVLTESQCVQSLLRLL